MQNPIRKLVYTSERKFRNNFICKNSKSSMRKAKFSVQDDPYDVLSRRIFGLLDVLSRIDRLSRGMFGPQDVLSVDCFVV